MSIGVLTNVLASVGVGYRIGRVFEFMRIAEEELDRAKVRQSCDLLELYPGAFLTMHPELYRAHAREIAARIKAGRDLGLGTRAEVLRLMVLSSLDAPLKGEGVAIYERLFAEIMPGAFERLGLGKPRDERWPGQVEEDIAEMQRKIAGTRQRI